MHLHRHLYTTALVGTVLVSATTAQRTWTVGTGGRFSDIQAAINAAKPGDTVLVRRGNYSPATSSKGIRLLGGPGVVIRRFPSSKDLLTVTSLPADQTMIIEGFELTVVNSHQTAAVRLAANLGRVILQDVSMKAVPFSNAGGYGLEIENCRQVSINSCTAVGEPAVLCTDSVLNIGSCELSGQDAFDFRGNSWHSDNALRATGSRVTIGGSTLTGGSGALRAFSGVWEASSAAVLKNCRTVMVGDKNAGCIAGTPPSGGKKTAALQVLGGLLLIDPSVTLASGGNTPPISATGVVVSARHPALRATGAPPGSTLQGELYCRSGNWLVLAVSTPAAWKATPFGDFWLDSATLSVLALARMGPSQHWPFRLRVPANGALQGLGVVLQGAAGSSTRNIRLSNPAVVVVH